MKYWNNGTTIEGIEIFLISPVLIIRPYHIRSLHVK